MRKEKYIIKLKNVDFDLYYTGKKYTMDKFKHPQLTSNKVEAKAYPTLHLSNAVIKTINKENPVYEFDVINLEEN